MIRKFALLGIVAYFAAVAVAQGPSVSQIAPPTVQAAPGKTVPVKLQFRVADYYHINSHKPLDELLLPTELKLSPPTDIMVSGVTYPEGHMLQLPFSPESKLSVYSGDFDVTAKLRPAQNMPSGTFRIHGELKFQACNDRQCFPPKTTPVAFDVKVAKAKRHK